MEDKATHRLQDTAFAITRWVGSPQSIVAHTITFDSMLLVLTTVVSLEAIYLSIFIQMSLNITSANLAEVEQDIDAMQEDVEEIQEDMGEIQEDMGEIQEDIGEIQEDMGEIQEDVDELQEDIEEMTEEEATEDAADVKSQKTLEQIHEGLQKLMQDIEKLQNKVI
jgi:peptidoglycan hydrolase CwlO-like protein